MSQCDRLIKKFNHTQIRANKPTHTFTTTMKALSVAETAYIVSFLEAGLSIRKIQSLTGLAISTISRLHSKHLPDSPKSLGGHPSKLSPTNIHYAVCLLLPEAGYYSTNCQSTIQHYQSTYLNPNT